MVYGVLKFINFAHGDVYMVGAYVGFFAFTAVIVKFMPGNFWAQYLITLILCMGACGAMGAFIERLAYRPLRNALGPADSLPWALFCALYFGLFLGPKADDSTSLNAVAAFFVVTGVAFVILIPILRGLFSVLNKRLQPSRNRLNALITAIGISLLLENQGQALFTATPQTYPNLPPLGLKASQGATTTLKLGAIELSINEGRIVILIAAVVLTALLVYLVRFTRVGRAIRAVSLDPDAAALQGIPTDRIIALTFVLGAALAGAAGFLNHNFGQISFKPDVGIQLGLKAFVAAVLGGIGSIEGAVLGALLMGLAESFVGGSSLNAYKNAIAFIILIVVLLFRPSGILGKHTTEKV